MNQAEILAGISRVLASGRPAANVAERTVEAHASIVDLILSRHSATVTTVLGICGPQGSGKSTMTRALSRVLGEVTGLSVATLSLDDLYLSRDARMELARSVHPLLITRGVPGTHDIDLGIQIIKHLAGAAATTETRIPRFDKALDEPKPVALWDRFAGRADIIILEGWCVGAAPQDGAALVSPVNVLEHDDDKDGRWRRYVNDCLKNDYQSLFSMVDILVMLSAPGFESVRGWRQQQEDELATSSEAAQISPSRSRIMSEAEIARFVSHFERITRHILTEMPHRADLVLHLDRNRIITRVVKNQRQHSGVRSSSLD